MHVAFTISRVLHTKTLFNDNSAICCTSKNYSVSTSRPFSKLTSFDYQIMIFMKTSRIEGIDLYKNIAVIGISNPLIVLVNVFSSSMASSLIREGRRHSFPY